MAELDTPGSPDNPDNPDTAVTPTETDTEADPPAAAGPRLGRPQPVGVFPLPAGFLLVAGGDETAELRRTLAAGRHPAAWPPELRAVELAHAGDLLGAAAAMTGDDPVDRYNRFVLRPAGMPVEDPAALRAALGPELGVLVDVVRFALGEVAEAPQRGGGAGGVPPRGFAAGGAGAQAAGAPPWPGPPGGWGPRRPCWAARPERSPRWCTRRGRRPTWRRAHR
ncbi:hypothetical protein [Frankia sp. AgB32]|uniref:hypothetical protein n=1 Tax=Frankia sp. AgB32 TaxID=631119 RepID=UPI00200DD523|nr:hypothetical protein [Frankia sp. AgB32]MCK9896796.1 hypothetical protein [Frankia sp. AgB32]